MFSKKIASLTPEMQKMFSESTYKRSSTNLLQFDKIKWNLWIAGDRHIIFGEQKTNNRKTCSIWHKAKVDSEEW